MHRSQLGLGKWSQCERTVLASEVEAIVKPGAALGEPHHLAAVYNLPSLESTLWRLVWGTSGQEQGRPGGPCTAAGRGRRCAQEVLAAAWVSRWPSTQQLLEAEILVQGDGCLAGLCGSLLFKLLFSRGRQILGTSMFLCTYG